MGERCSLGDVPCVWRCCCLSVCLSVLPSCSYIRRWQLHGIDINDRRTTVVRCYPQRIRSTSGLYALVSRRIRKNLGCFLSIFEVRQ